MPLCQRPRKLEPYPDPVIDNQNCLRVKYYYNVSIGKSPQKGRGDFKLPIPSLTSPPSVVDNNDKVTLPEDDASDTTEEDIDDLREDVTNVIAEPFMTLNNKNNVIKYYQSDNDSSSHTPERKSNLGESSPTRLTSSLSSVSLSASAIELVSFNPAKLSQDLVQLFILRKIIHLPRK